MSENVWQARMAAPAVPWWRRALSFALDGLRSGFGLFARSAKADGSGDEGNAELGNTERLPETLEAGREEPELMEAAAQPDAAGEPEIVAAEIAAAEPPVEIETAVREDGAEPVAEQIEEPERVEAVTAVEAVEETEEPESVVEPEPVDEPAPLVEAVSEVVDISEAEAADEPVAELIEEAVAEEQPELEAGLEAWELEAGIEPASEPVEEPEATEESTVIDEPKSVEIAEPVLDVELVAEEVPRAEEGNEPASELIEEAEAEIVIEPEALEAQVVAAASEVVSEPVEEVKAAEEVEETEEPESLVEPDPVEEPEPLVETKFEVVEVPEAEAPHEPAAELIEEAVAEEQPELEAGVEASELEAGIEPASEPVEEPEATEESAAIDEPESVEIAEPFLDVEPVVVEVLRAEVASEPVAEAVEEADSEDVPEPEIVEEISVLEFVSEPASELVEEPEAEIVLEPQAIALPVLEGVSEPVAEPLEELEAETHSEPEAIEESSELEAAIEPASELVEEVTVSEELEPVQAADPALEVEPEEAETPETESVSEPILERVEEPELVEEAKEAEPVAEAAEVIEAAPTPIPEADATPHLVLAPVPTPEEKADEKAEEKAAAKLAARQKKLDESSEQSPFSVFVGQVYDGPLDLLLDLIRKQDIDIYDIPIATITAQFLAYVNQLKAGDVDVAGEFIYTASLLIHIKSRMLLPRASTATEDAAEDPRRELVERLLEHERFKNAAQMLQQKQMLEAASWTNPGAREFKNDEGAEPEIAADTVDLVRIFRDILERARKRPVINMEEDSVTVGQMIQFLARRLTMEDKPVALRRLLSHTRSERALIAMFLALLELVRMQAILLRQDLAFSEIFIKKHTGFEAVMNDGLVNARDDWR